MAASRGTLGSGARRLWADTSGVILPYVTIMLVVIVGTSVLALDGARYMSLHTQLQKGADALALAGAAELDRLPTAITRATNAVDNLLVSNASLFGPSGSQTVVASSIRFLRSLPASDTSPIDGANVLCSAGGCTADHAVLARYIEVTVTPVTMPTILPASIFGGANSQTTGAVAVAGFDQVVCSFTPMFVCNPYETAGMTYDQATQALVDAVATPAIRRRQIEMRRGGGGGGQWSPGNYGFLDSAGASGANALRDAIAKVRPGTCFRQSGVNTQPGFVASVRDAVNVRFDMYDGSMNSVKNNADYRPAMNVRKGYLLAGGGGGGGGNTCNAAPASNPAQAMGLPRDNCFATGTCPNMGGRMGDGAWNFDSYWSVNHTVGGALRPVPQAGGAPASNTNLPSRYDVYRYEIAQGYIGDRSPGNPPSTPGEAGAPICTSSAVNNTPDRRIFNGAIVNCLSNLPPSLPLGPGNQSGIPVAAFAKFFITQPVEAAQDDIVTEIVDLVKPGDASAQNFDMVQLYR
jgi:hypothetical protein